MNTPTVADILRCGFSSFERQVGRQPLQHLKAVSAITACRTSALGGVRQQCDHCGHEVLRFRSCGNRHCPQCQSAKRFAWVADRVEELLPVGYFHVVFTVPAPLRPFALRNKKPFYDLMFRAVKETLYDLSADPKRLGADSGCICVLHTWGQTLVDHPHIHCIVPGGGFDEKCSRWKPAKNAFLFPVPVIRKLYRGKMLAMFKAAVRSGVIALHGTLQQYDSPQAFSVFLDALYRAEWVVYVKRPFASAEALVKYLGAYTHRVAISNQRILGMDGNHVAFSYKDYADDDRIKHMRLPIAEFIRRFLLHVLPRGYTRIRYCGFLAPRARKKRLERIRRFFRKKLLSQKRRGSAKPWHVIFKELTGTNPLLCPVCATGILVFAGLASKYSP